MSKFDLETSKNEFFENLIELADKFDITANSDIKAKIKYPKIQIGPYIFSQKSNKYILFNIVYFFIGKSFNKNTKKTQGFYFYCKEKLCLAKMYVDIEKQIV